MIEKLLPMNIQQGLFLLIRNSQRHTQVPNKVLKENLKINDCQGEESDEGMSWFALHAFSSRIWI